MAAPAGAWKRPIPPEFRGSWADATDDHPASDVPKSKAALRRERATRQKVLQSQNWTNKERDVFLAAQQRERDSGKQSKGSVGVDAARRQRTLERWAKSEFHPLKPSQGVQYADILAIDAPTTPSAPTKSQPAKRKVKRDTKAVLVRDDRRRKPHKVRVCKKLRRLTRLKKSVLADREAQFHGAPTSAHLTGVVAKLRDDYNALFNAHLTSDAEAVSVTEKRIARGVRQLGRVRLAPSAVAAPTAPIVSAASTPTADAVSSPVAVVAGAPRSDDEDDRVTADVVAPLLRPLFPPLSRYVGLGAHPMASSLDQREGTHRLVRGFVTNVLSRDLDSATKGLLKRLEGLQHNARKREPLKYKKQQRFVLGLREVARGIEVGRIRLVAIAPDVEPAQDLDSRVEQIVAMCVERSIPHFFALSRSGFGHAVHKHDQRISVVGFYSVQGADEQGKELVRLARAAKEDAERILSEAPVS